VEAVSRVFQHRSGAPIFVGGVKPALGHSEGASGISSIIKMVLALENGVIPATIGVKKVNPSIKLDEWNVDIVRENRAWPPSAVRRVGVNSFGFGGANGHVIIEAAPRNDHLVHQKSHTNGVGRIGKPTDELHQNGRGDNLDPVGITLFSAATEDSLLKQFNNIGRYLTENGSLVNSKDLEYTLNCRRSRLATRGFLVAPKSSFQNDLGLLSPTIQADKAYEALDLTFVYTGQGAQWPGIAWELIHRFPSFKKSIRYYDACLQALDEAIRPSWTIEETILNKDANTIHLSDRSQPVCTAVQLALTNLLRGWNIKPRTVLGHSSGEIAAAYAGDFISARQAILCSYLRGLSVSLSKEQGGMLATGLNRDQAQDAIDELGLKTAITVACINSPGSTTLSGDSTAIDKLLSVFQERGTFARKLRTGDKAYHSHHMHAVGPVYEELLQRVWHDSEINGKANGHSESTIRMISSVTKTNVTATDVATPHYWRINLESPVEFEAAVSLALENGPTHFIELGPHSALELPIKETVNKVNGTSEGHLYHSALSRGKDSSVSVLSLVGSLFLHRHDEISFQAILESDSDSSHRPVQVIYDLPAYPWDYGSSCPWTEPRNVTEFRNRKYPRHDLLGSQLAGASKANTTWRNILNVEEISWLKDHRLGPSIVFPAAAYIAMATEAVCQVNDIPLHECPGVTLKNVCFLKAMDFHIEQRPQIEIFTELEPLRLSNTTLSAKWWRFSVSSISRDQSQSTTHAVCLVGISSGAEARTSTQRRINLDRSLMEQQATHVWYNKFTQEGLNWGPQFAVMKDIFCDSARKSYVASATTHLVREEDVFPQGDGHLKYIVHPINIDALLQTAFVATTRGWARDLRATVPVSIETVQISSPADLDMNIAQSWFIDSNSEPVGFGTVKIDAEMINESKNVLVSMKNVRAIRFQGNARTETPKANTPLVRVAWKPDVTVLAAGPNKGFSRYLDWFTNTYSREGSIEESDVRLAAALDLIAFKWPNSRVLAVDCKTETISIFKNILRDGDRTRRFETFEQATVGDDGKLHSLHEDFDSNNSVVQNGVLEFSGDVRFDIVIISNVRNTIFIKSKLWS
jgi:acyl transferase domain-containing protein